MEANLSSLNAKGNLSIWMVATWAEFIVQWSSLKLRLSETDTPMTMICLIDWSEIPRHEGIHNPVGNYENCERRSFLWNRDEINHWKMVFQLLAWSCCAERKVHDVGGILIYWGRVYTLSVPKPSGSVVGHVEFDPVVSVEPCEVQINKKVKRYKPKEIHQKKFIHCRRSLGWSVKTIKAMAQHCFKIPANFNT